MKKSPEYRVWSHLRGRCNNETDARYDNWGGRGIAVCPEWDSFEQFYADMGPRPVGTTIDRKDNSKGYSKENCRWATHTEQTRNRRCSWYIPTAQGMFSTKEYSEHYGLSYHMVRAWVQRRKIFAIQPFAGEPSWSQLR